MIERAWLITASHAARQLVLGHVRDQLVDVAYLLDDDGAVEHRVARAIDGAGLPWPSVSARSKRSTST